MSKKLNEEQLEKAIRDLYWDNMDQDEKNSLYDSIQCAFDNLAGERVLTDQYVKDTFYELPFENITEGLNWGFSDTENRESVCSFVMRKYLK